MPHRNHIFHHNTPFSHVPEGVDPPKPTNVRGPVSFLNPTRAEFSLDAAHTSALANIQTSWATDSSTPAVQSNTAPTFYWTSRDNRKGRHTLLLPAFSLVTTNARLTAASATALNPSRLRKILHNLYLMLTHYPFHDISYSVAFLYTLGSVVWVMNGFFSFLPVLAGREQFAGESLYGVGITAVIGAAIFEVASVLLMVEAVKEDTRGCVGWAVEKVVVDETTAPSEVKETRFSGANAPTSSVIWKARPQKHSCWHHNARGGFFSRTKNIEPQGKDPELQSPQGASSTKIRTHWHSLSWQASLIQLIAATIFFVPCIPSIPPIYTSLSYAALLGLIWFPQVIGGSGFVLSSLLFMVETQRRWWLPAPRVLGWWIGLFNLIGGVGFTLCPIFAIFWLVKNPVMDANVMERAHWAAYQSALATLWGSWAFLIGSALQWYESLDKFPVRIVWIGRSFILGFGFGT